MLWVRLSRLLIREERDKEEHSRQIGFLPHIP